MKAELVDPIQFSKFCRVGCSARNVLCAKAVTLFQLTSLVFDVTIFVLMAVKYVNKEQVVCFCFFLV